MENVQNPVETWIAVVAQHYFFASLSNFCRKTMPNSTSFDRENTSTDRHNFLLYPGMGYDIIKEKYAGMMKLVDMRDLGSRAAMRWGSSPHTRTKKRSDRICAPLFTKPNIQKGDTL